MSSYSASIWKRSSNKLRQGEVWLEYFYLSGLFVAASILFLINLAGLPLLDPDEAVLAQVAKEIYQSTESWSGIFPSLWNEPYLDTPPLVHNLVAIAYKIAGVNELTTRFPGALLGAVSTILVYSVGREIFVARLPALFSALVYLTCLPVVRFSRLATLDGPLLCFEILTIWAVLRSRRDLRWAAGAGLGWSLMSLTKGLFGVQILLLALLFLLWDTPRLLTSAYFWTGLAIGSLPCLAWYLAQWLRYGDLESADLINLVMSQTAAVNIGLGLPISYYLLQSLQYFVPWSVVMFAGLKSIEPNLHWGWGKLLAVWLGGYIVIGFLLLERNYWFVLPLYPALALAAGRELSRIRNLPSYVAYPQMWVIGFSLMAILAASAGLYWGINNYVDFYLPFICGSLCVTFGATAVAISQRDSQFIPLLFWGLFVSMFLLFVSPHWIWEMKAITSVKPIAEFIRQHTPPKATIYSSMSNARPSLNFYSDRQVIPQSIEELEQHWQQNSAVYLLLDSSARIRLNLPPQAIVKDNRPESSDWVLAIKKEKSTLAWISRARAINLDRDLEGWRVPISITESL